MFKNLMLRLYILVLHLVLIHSSKICCKQSQSMPSIGIIDPDGQCCQRHQIIPSKEEIMELDVIPRISCSNLTIEEFIDVYEHPRKAVILVDCDKYWKAKDSWTFENLVKRLDLNSKWRFVHLEQDANTFEEDIEQRIQWKYAVEAMQNNKKWYIFDNLNTTDGMMLEEDYSTPPFFRNDLFQHLHNFPNDYGPMRWFALGSKYTGTNPHFDPFETDAWNSVVHGAKWWMLFPSSAQQYVDENDEYDMLGCDPNCSEQNLSILDYYSSIWFHSSEVSNMFQDNKSIRHVLQKEGETLYVPSNTIHSVLNIDDTVAITANYGSLSNIHNLWSILLDFDVELDDLKKVYCQVLDIKLRNEVEFDYDCDVM